MNPGVQYRPTRFAGLVEWVNLLLALGILAIAWVLVVQFLDWTARHHWPHR